jgi:hypothetical protein
MRIYWCIFSLIILTCCQRKLSSSLIPTDSTSQTTNKAKKTMIETYKGKAVNAKAGAVLQTSGGSYYMENMQEWPGELLNKEVSVEGILEERKMISDPVNEKGEIVQGSWGTQFVLTKHRITEIR